MKRISLTAAAFLARGLLPRVAAAPLSNLSPSFLVPSISPAGFHRFLRPRGNDPRYGADNLVEERENQAARHPRLAADIRSANGTTLARGNFVSLRPTLVVDLTIPRRNFIFRFGSFAFRIRATPRVVRNLG